MIQPESAIELNVSIDQSFLTPKVAPLGSILMIRHYPETIHFEVDANTKALLYDDAVNALSTSCIGIDFEEVNSIKFHTNSWGLSSCNYFAENVLSKMLNLKSLEIWGWGMDP